METQLKSKDCSKCNKKHDPFFKIEKGLCIDCLGKLVSQRFSNPSPRQTFVVSTPIKNDPPAIKCEYLECSCYEDQLPNMTDDEYNGRYKTSKVVDGVRMGETPEGTNNE